MHACWVTEEILTPHDVSSTLCHCQAGVSRAQALAGQPRSSHVLSPKRAPRIRRTALALAAQLLHDIAAGHLGHKAVNLTRSANYKAASFSSQVHYDAHPAPLHLPDGTCSAQPWPPHVSRLRILVWAEGCGWTTRSSATHADRGQPQAAQMAPHSSATCQKQPSQHAPCPPGPVTACALPRWAPHSMRPASRAPADISERSRCSISGTKLWMCHALEAGTGQSPSPRMSM